MASTFVPATSSDYRLGFTSLDREVTIARVPATGKLPDWLHGSLLRNGPARFEVGADTYRHWFDGLAMLHRFTLAGGNVSYANRFLRSPAFEAAERCGRIALAEFGTNPQRSLGERINAFLHPQTSHNANVSIAPYRDAFLALTETPQPVAFDGTSLETRGVLAYDDTLKGQMTTAHAHHDRNRGASWNIVTEFGRISKYHVVRIADGTLHRTLVASITVDAPAYMHAFATTERYVIIAEYPLVVRPLEMLVSRKAFIDNYRWEPERATRFHVIAKDGGARVASYEAPAFFAFHHINAFEERDALVLDISAYDDARIIHDFELDLLRRGDTFANARAAFRRYRLVPGRSTAEVETVATEATELPRIAPSRAASTYRYAFGVDMDTARPQVATRLVKVDTHDRRVIAWSAPNAYPGEPLFVPRPVAHDEDDGVILSVVLDAEAATSYLLVLDARTLVEHARAVLPHHIPYGFHGMFSTTEDAARGASQPPPPRT